MEGEVLSHHLANSLDDPYHQLQIKKQSNLSISSKTEKFSQSLELKSAGNDESDIMTVMDKLGQMRAETKGVMSSVNISSHDYTRVNSAESNENTNEEYRSHVQKESQYTRRRQTKAENTSKPSILTEGFDLDVLVASQGIFSGDEFEVSDFDNGDDEDTATDILVAQELTDRQRAQMHAARIHAKHSLPPQNTSINQPSFHNEFLDVPVLRRHKISDSQSVEKQERRRSIKELVNSFEEQFNPFMVSRSHSQEYLPSDRTDLNVSQRTSLRESTGSVPNLHKQQ